MYFHFLPNTQSQTQAVTECLHCLLQSTGSPPAFRWFWDRFDLPRKTWLGASADARSTWVHSPRRGISRWAQADTWHGTHTWECSWHCHRGDGGQVSLSKTPSSYGPLRAFMAESVSIGCVALKQSNNVDYKGQGAGSSQHTCKVSKGYHRFSHSLWEQAGLAGRITALVFPPV